MKSFFVLVLFSIAIASRADFVIQEQVKSADQEGVVTLKVKGDKTRLDTPTTTLGDVSVIEDMNTCDKIMMIHQRKLAKMQSAAEQTPPADSNATQSFVDTRKSEKIGSYDTEIYTWTNSIGASGTFWIAKSFPNYPKFQALFKKIHDSKMGQILKGTQPNRSALPGMVIKAQIKTSLGEITRTLISAKEEPVAATDFQIPPDYKVLGLQFGK